MRRLVLLGASNLTRSFPMVLSLARNTFGGPLSILAAHGLGRSYGLEAGNFGKKFPGIFFSGIWPALGNEKSAPTAAWITDIGNDLAYEVPVERIVEWVTGCVERLQQIDAQIVITDLPLATLRQVGELRFRFFRSLFFSRCRISRIEMLARASALSMALQELGEARKIPIFSAPNEWYGIDPIHPRQRHLQTMWQQLFAITSAGGNPNLCSEESWVAPWRMWRLNPEKWTHFSFSRRANQPSGRLRDGSTIALY